FLDYTWRKQSALSDASLVEQQFDQADGKTKTGHSSVDPPEADADVGHADGEADRLVANFREQRCLRHDERLPLVREVIELSLGKGNKAPVFFLRLIVDFAKPSAFVAEIFEISRANRDRPAPAKPRGELPQMHHGF